MKSNKGITLTSLIIYVTAMSFVIGIITVISTYFYNNISTLTKSTREYKQYTKFNSFFIQDINKSGNVVVECNEDYIKFRNGNDYNQYTFKNNCIYFNKVKICENIDKCIFEYRENSDQNIINVKITVKNSKSNFDTDYTLKKW